MNFDISANLKHIFVLGAGASVEYGLPVWKELGNKIKEKVNSDNGNSYKYKKEIMSWVDKVGEKGIYSTLDECIFKESVSPAHHEDGIDVEDEIFSVIKDVFNDTYREGNDGWIRKLNEKILSNSALALEQQMVFINYNYDHVLDDNFLNYDHLAKKYKRVNFKTQLHRLSITSVKTLCPHGTLFPFYEKRPSHLEKYFDTIKTDDGELLDVVSCYESKTHKIDDARTNGARKLYILGLGGGLKINLGRLVFGIPISEIHVTIRDKNLRDEILGFLSEKFKIPPGEIQVYDSCEELIEKCF